MFIRAEFLLYTAFIDLPDTINVNEVGPPMEICVNLTLPEDRTVVLNTVFQQADTVSGKDSITDWRWNTSKPKL